MTTRQIKQKQMEVMREARKKAIAEGISFYTINLFHPSGHKRGGNIMAAVKRISGEEFAIGELGKHLLEVTKSKFYRVQYSFCSPNEKNPSRIFGEGLAALRFFNEKSALAFRVDHDENLLHLLRLGALEYARMRRVPWLAKATIGDLV